MTRYLLDTNIISNLVEPVPSEALLAWMGERIDEDLHISAWTVAEVWRGILQAPAGRKRRALEAWFEGPEGPQTLFAGRVLAFDDRAGLAWAVAAGNDCVIVTDNEKDFAGLDFINPLRMGGGGLSVERS